MAALLLQLDTLGLSTLVEATKSLGAPVAVFLVVVLMFAYVLKAIVTGITKLVEAAIKTLDVHQQFTHKATEQLTLNLAEAKFTRETMVEGHNQLHVKLDDMKDHLTEKINDIPKQVVFRGIVSGTMAKELAK